MPLKLNFVKDFLKSLKWLSVSTRTSRVLIVFFSLTFQFILHSSHAQLAELGINPQTLIEPSPEVQSISRYGSLPHNKYTGATTFNLPLYEIQFEELTIPITLSYYSSGLRSREEASWAGLGWNLTAHAAISRSIKDGDDLSQNNNNGKIGWVYQTEFLPDNMQPNYLYFSNSLIMTISNSVGNPRIKPDTEPDIFSVNLFGTSLEFILGKKGETNVIEGKSLDNPNYRISYDLITNNFEIRDDKGYTYFFTNKEYSNLFDTYYQYDILTAWFIDRITSPQGKSLLFQYNSSGSGMAIRSIPSIVSTTYRQYFFTDGTCGHTTAAPGGATNYSIYTENSSNYLDKIINGNEEIKFVTSDRLDIVPINGIHAQKLDAIKIIFGGVDKKRIDFTNSYFNQDKANDPAFSKYLRLKLDLVKIRDEIYSFEYESPDALPLKDTKGVDIWGYYNGRTSNTSDIPWNTVSVTASDPSAPPSMTVSISGDSGGDRDADFNFSKIGRLKKIIYPTGGYSEFEIEANTVKLPYDQIFGWERHKGTQQSYSNMSTSSTAWYTFNVPVTSSFGSSLSSLGIIEFNINKSGDPLDIYNAVDANKDEVAIELRGPNDELLKTIKFGEFNTFCYQDPDQFLCSTTDGSNYCYCYSSKSFYFGVLQPGNYSILFKRALTLSANGTTYTLYPSVKIKTPTGVYRDKEVGGIRVSALTDFERNGKRLTKRSFKYNDDTGYSSGKLMSIPTFHREKEMNTQPQNPGSVCSPLYCPNTFYYVVFSSSSLTSPETSAQGLHIGYNVVDEIFLSSLKPSDNHRNSTIFHNTPNSEVLSIPKERILSDVCFSGEFHADYSVTALSGIGLSYKKQNGKPISETLYNNLDQKASETEYGYSYALLERYGATKLSMRTALVFPQAQQRIDRYTNYYLNQDIHHLTSIKKTVYSPAGNVVTTNSYTFDNRWYAKTETSQNSDRDLTVITNYYPHDYAILTGLTNNNIYGKPVKQETTVNGKLVKGVVVEYNDEGLASKINRYEGSALLAPPVHDPSTLIPGGYFKKSEYTFYPGSINIKQHLPQDGNPTTYLWGYGGRYIVAKIEGITFDLVNGLFNQSILDQPGNDQALRSEIASLRSDPLLINKPITCYTYNPLVGLTSKTDQNGQTSYYEYDQLGRPIAVKDPNGDISKTYEYSYNIKD